MKTSSRATDTPPEVDERYRRMLLARSPAERVRMACRMFATGRTLMKAGLGAQDEPSERREVFLRLYGDDFTAPQREAILRTIEAHAAEPA